jgi:iron(III) transport system substrate-binding protein
MANDGDEAAATWVNGVKSNLARKPQGNDRAQVKAISEGVCDLSIINHYYMGNMLSDEEQAEWADSVLIIFPNQDDRGTHVNISGMALTKSAPNRDNAIRLMEFLSADLAQRMYAEQNFEYPVRPDTRWSGLLESFGQFKSDDLPLAEVAKRRPAAVRLVDQTDFDG